MKKICLAVMLVLIVAGLAFATLPRLPFDSKGQTLQGFAPDGKKTVALTVNSTVVNMTDDLKWIAYTPTACKFRLQSTATKVGTTLTLPANAATERVKNPSTPFANFTGCTSGELQRQ